jgi:thioesterase domain-containing protein
MMMIRPFTRPAVLALALLAIVPAAQAQTKKELVAKVVQLQQPAVEAIATGIARDTAARMMDAAGQALGNVPADKREALGKQIQADIKAFYEDMQGKLRDSGAKNAATTLGPLLEEKFSEDELKQIAVWLESPAAKKYQQLGGEMQSLLSRKLVEDTRPAIEPKLKALEQTLQKRFAQATPAAGAASAPSSAKPASAPAKKK